MIRGALASVARNESLGGLIGRTPVAREVMRRVVGGETVDSAVEVARDLADRGFWVSLERAAVLPADDVAAGAVAEEYQALLAGVVDAGLAGVGELAVLPETLGIGAEASASDRRLLDLAGTAAQAHVPLMLGHGPTTDLDACLRMHRTLADEGLHVGITLPAAVRRSEAEVRTLADSRVRLVKGGRGGRSPVAHAQPIEIDKAFVRCAKVLLAGSGDPSFATHDPRLISIVEDLATRYHRAPESFEFTFFMGRQEGAQERLLGEGDRVRVYVPYGPQWFERLVAGLAEQPSTITAAVRSLLPGSS